MKIRLENSEDESQINLKLMEFRRLSIFGVTLRAVAEQARAFLLYSAPITEDFLGRYLW